MICFFVKITDRDRAIKKGLAMQIMTDITCISLDNIMYGITLATGLEFYGSNVLSVVS